MSTYRVTSMIQTKDGSNVPVEVQFYKGDNLAVAVAALAQCAVDREDREDLPESVQYRTLSVHMDITEEG